MEANHWLYFFWTYKRTKSDVLKDGAMCAACGFSLLSLGLKKFFFEKHCI